ncbi:hypothetical protein CP500_014090 [Tychonema bourrellyi FEM_GT703]|uniref:Topoisomerase 6 subunit A/Spo11 TOPRIM domain-containing protein n=1 Tax=Tychonema bourrellyi FEM_GT703 TaxID=2040638 RepID=A0A2G4EZ42_9CYAN|nr:hypothetical protein [Tychonema bourrellyi]PHX54794.1 hypothetical protein CP500_014090 [Tychonema bourrellyi FEM_GT703]
MGMKCVQCNTDNDLSDRTTNSGKCINCNHPFVFDPATITEKKFAFTDPFFQKAIADISSQNMLFFTPKQFLYLIDKRLKYPASANRWAWINPYFILLAILLIFSILFIGILFPQLMNFIIATHLSLMLLVLFVIYNSVWMGIFFANTKSIHQGIIGRKNNAKNLQVLGGIILVAGISVSLIANYFPGYIAAAALGLFSCWLGTSQKNRKQGFTELFLVNQAQSDEWLQRWQTVNGALEKLLPAPRQEALPASIDPEVSAYSFDRAIICDNDEIAQFLIANNVHFENNCAILSISGYPQSIFDTVIEMLRRNADLKVYALHDANPAGVSLVHQLRTSPNWFADQVVTIFDLGISPRQILETRDMFVQQSQTMAQSARQLPNAVRQGLTAQELAWLDAGNFVELESFTPQRLLRVVNYGLAQSGDPQGNEGLILVDDNVGYGGGYVFVSDSFG